MAEKLMMLGVPVTLLSRRQIEQRVLSLVETGRGALLATVNPEFVMEARANPRFRTILQHAALAIPDGIGLWFASVWMGTPLKARYTGVALTEFLVARAAERGLSVYFFGGNPGVAEATAHVFATRYPTLHVAGAETGPSITRQEMNNGVLPDSVTAAIDVIGATRPAIVFIALGAPKQEQFAAALLARYPDIRIAMGVGGTFDFFAGNAHRAPTVFQRLGLEWLWRLFLEPWRWRRIIIAVVLFPLQIMLHETPWKRSASE